MERFSYFKEELLDSWDEIMARYNALNHKSRSTKKLAEWGFVLSSAYVLKPQAASDMWQHVIDINTQDDASYSTYFVKWIFRQIKGYLKILDAASFLFLNTKRVDMLCEIKSDLYCVVGYFLHNDMLKPALNYLKRYCDWKNNESNDMELKKIYEAMLCIVNTTKAQLNDQEDCFKINVSHTTFLLDELIEKAPNSVYKNVCCGMRSVFSSTPLSKTSEVEEISADLLQGYNTLIFKFLYLNSEFIQGDKINEMLKKIDYSCKSIQVERDDVTIDEYNWLLDIVVNNEDIAVKVFSSSLGALSSFEEEILDRFAANEKWHIYSRCIVAALNNGNNCRCDSCFTYIETALNSINTEVGTTCLFNGFALCSSKIHCGRKSDVYENLSIEQAHELVASLTGLYDCLRHKRHQDILKELLVEISFEMYGNVDSLIKVGVLQFSGLVPFSRIKSCLQLVYDRAKTIDESCEKADLIELVNKLVEVEKSIGNYSIVLPNIIFDSGVIDHIDIAIDVFQEMLESDDCDECDVSEAMSCVSRAIELMP